MKALITTLALLSLSGIATAHQDNRCERSPGKVKWFNTTKGYGFIEQEASEDVFVHYRSIAVGRKKLFSNVPYLNEGDRVTFCIEELPKGQQAIDVRLEE